MSTSPGMKHTALAAIEFDSSTQVRAAIDVGLVGEYAAQMESGDKFPWPDLFQDGERFFIGDGWHRLLAAQKNDAVTFPCMIYPGGKSAAVRHALGANAKHGLKRSHADKRKAVEVALREFGNLSDREIGKICAVAHSFVGNVRAAQLDSKSSSTEARLGADGKIRKMPVQTMRHEPRGEVERTATVEAPPVGGTLTAIAEDARPKKKASAPFAMPARGTFIARGAIVQLEQILPDDGERAEALRLVRDWCNQQLNET